MMRQYVTVYVELPTRAELIGSGKLIYNGWQFGQANIYLWRGRQYTIPKNRGKPKIVWFEAEYDTPVPEATRCKSRRNAAPTPS